MGTWVEDETAGCDLGDARLNRRLGMMLAALGERPGKSLPTAVNLHSEVTRVFHRELTRLKVMFCGLCWGQGMCGLLLFSGGR